MRFTLTYLLCAAICIIMCIQGVYAQDTRRAVENQIYLSPENDYLKDTLYDKNGNVQDPDRLYNRLLNSRSGLVRNVANIILVGGDTRLEVDSLDQEIALSENYFNDYEGLTIDSIAIIRKNIFTPDDSMATNSKGEQFLDKAHVMTKDRVVRKYLLFKEGDRVDPLTMSTNEYLLRDLSFITSAFIIINHSDKGGVNVFVFVRDNWSIFADWETGDFPRVGLYDDNFLGSGDRIKLSYLIKGDKQKSGVQLNYDFRNLFGSFIDANLQVGVGGTQSFIGTIERKYRVPGDMYWKAYGGYTNKGERTLNYDTVLYPKRMEFIGSYGHSFKLSKSGLFTYFSVSGQYLRFDEAPMRTFVFNPYYHDNNIVLANFGIARQHFFQGNMIYGYGNVEDIPYGFKFEITGGMGYSPQTNNYQYFGALARYSFYSNNFGYLDATAKGCIRHLMTNKTWNLGMGDFRLNYFSPLLKLGKGYYLRNFLYFSWTQGINRFIGERELLEYTSKDGVRGLYAPYWAYGTSRACLRAESVIFTPLYLLHFRLAGFVWGDMGWLGDNSMFWDNQISAAAGIGVRIKNERLIINNLEIRLGVGIRTYPERGFSWINFSNENRLRAQNFNPTAAEMYEFK